jgi:hypothetical protein
VPVSEERTNAASEFLVAGCSALNEGAPSPDVRANLTDDFLFEDRRRGRLLGQGGADDWHKFLLSTWQTGAGDPHYRVSDIVALRGDRFAACRLELDYGNGMTTENVEVIGLDPTLTLLQVVIDFDADDIDAAIAELDRLHRQTKEC